MILTNWRDMKEFESYMDREKYKIGLTIYKR